jgi:hypothetical protein
MRGRNMEMIPSLLIAALTALAVVAVPTLTAAFVIREAYRFMLRRKK